jgi:hypothetical protein
MVVVSTCALSFMSKYLHQSCSPKPMTRVDINDKNQSFNNKDHDSQVWDMARRRMENVQRLLKQKPYIHHQIPRKESSQLVLTIARTTQESIKYISILFLHIRIMIMVTGLLTMT